MPSIAFNAKKFEKATEEELRAAQIYLQAFLKVYCGAIIKVRAMVPESVWVIYENTGLTGSAEQKCMRRAQEILREEWAKRPEILRRKPTSGLARTSSRK